MFIWIPIHIALAFENLIIPLKQLEVIIKRMLTIPINELEVLNLSLLHWTPKLHCPGVHTHMVVCPSIKATGNDLFGMIFEIMEDRDVWITREFRSLLTDLLERPQILGRHFIIGAVIIWPQQHATHRVK